VLDRLIRRILLVDRLDPGAEELLDLVVVDQFIDIEILDLLLLGESRSRSISGVRTATTYGRRSPKTMAWEMYLSSRRSFSIGWGAMFLPPAVTISSFLRSTI